MPRSPNSLPRPARAVSASTAKQRILKLLVCSDAHEQALRLRGFRSIAGVDEVGRGALFGPVVAAAVILPTDLDPLACAGLRDSKQLTAPQRESLDRLIRATALAVSIAEIDAATIDRVNIYQATRLAMLSAVRALAIAPDHLLIDAMQLDLSGWPTPARRPASSTATRSRSPSPPPPSSPRSTATASSLRSTPRIPATASPRTRGTPPRTSPRPHRPRPHPPPPPLLRPCQSHRPPTFHKNLQPIAHSPPLIAKPQSLALNCTAHSHSLIQQMPHLRYPSIHP